MNKITKATVLIAFIAGTLTVTAAETTSNPAALILNYHNPVQDIPHYHPAESLEKNLEKHQSYLNTLAKKQAEAIKTCEELYINGERTRCEVEINDAYKMLAEIPDIMDHIALEEAKPEDIEIEVDTETRQVAFFLIKKAFGHQANNLTP